MDTQEAELNFQQVWRMFAETRAQFAETRKRFEESDAKLTRMFAETRERIEATDEQVKKTSASVSDLTGKWGKFVEGLVAPAAIRLFAERGISVEGTAQRVKRRMNGTGIEVDVLAVNSEYVVLIEVKSTLGVDDVREHLDRLGRFKTFFPEYADRKVIGAVAGIVIDEGADRFAYKHGLFVIAQSGEMVTILNDEGFRPAVW